MFFLRNWKWFVFLFSIIGGTYLLHQLKEGFWFFSIQKQLPSFLESSPEELLAHQELLQQPFFYIGKGSQFYVFESFDKNYVLKLFKNKHIKDPLFLKKLCFFPFVKEIAQNTSKKRVLRRESLTKSLALAQKHLKNESAIILVHLTPVDCFSDPVNVFDKVGWQHCIDLNQTAFILQKKATPLPVVFSKLVAAKDHDQISSLLTSLKKMVQQCIKVGVIDTSDHLIHKTAYLENEGRTILMDIGKLSKSTNYINFNPEEYLAKSVQIVRSWSEINLPALLPYLSSIP